jgi:ATP-dependent helicase/DNAse subunit B
MPDKYKAVWVSHSSSSDFLKCPRSYFLKNIYKDPKTGNKMTLMSPPLALGQAVHNTLENLANLPTDKRFEKSLIDRFEDEWKKISGDKGGFYDSKIEKDYKERGMEMIKRVQKMKAPLNRLAIKIDMDLPNYWLSEEDNIILCGKVDWLEYLPDTDSVNIVDFKTGKSKEDEKSLQLPIYLLLVKNCQKRNVEKASYWYLESDDELTERELPDPDEAREKVLAVAKKMKLARQLKSFNCPKGDDGCMFCTPFEKLIKGEGKLVGTDEIRRDVYTLEKSDDENRDGVLM